MKDSKEVVKIVKETEEAPLPLGKKSSLKCPSSRKKDFVGGESHPGIHNPCQTFSKKARKAAKNYGTDHSGTGSHRTTTKARKAARNYKTDHSGTGFHRTSTKARKATKN